MKYRGPATALTAAACVTVISSMLTSCSSETEESSKTPAPSTSSAFPYPPLQFRWDIAVPLNEQATAAAQFALETATLESRMQIGEYDALLAQVNERVAYDNRPIPPSTPPLPETGGTLTRAVAVDEYAKDRWIVTYCDYDTPGAYTRSTDGSLRLSNPDWRYTAFQSNVALTTEKSGAGKAATTPRLLVVGQARDDFPKSREPLNADAICQPLMPEPFVRQPPAPVDIQPTK
ncbi:hypothetical protein LTV02_33890 [Nocardia yamanashiensis]|uniref:hypothetical protein n=1 Tax=Nocardia yamanashiensis TaxID=209247 RepID=UPI001E4A414C|nr:hypothetical protein [Nocardia yamanashiensis]UGT40912.1 hypothetical protein LTV02_33890 [Nocardia yamanashiensis]